MPRIDPLSLLKCLSVLLGPTGGIKSKEEVQRLANLMTKFSKKLVSKCIYIQILKTTNTELLSQFMGAGGWNLIHMWLTDGILAKNWALIQELLELLLLCPVDIERLKSNNCPKLIKGLSKEGSHQGVRLLASRLVEQWLKIVKGEAAPNSVPAHIMTVPVQSNAAMGQGLHVQPNQLQQLQQQEQQLQQYALNCGMQQSEDSLEPVTVQVQDLQYTQVNAPAVSVAQVQQQIQDHQQLSQEKMQMQPVHLQIIGKPQQMQLQQQQQQQQQQSAQQKKQSFVVVSTSSQSVPVYKITIRDGKQVLAKVETDAANISSVLNVNANSDVNGEITNDSSSADNGITTKVTQGVVSGEVISDANDVTNNSQTEQSERTSSEVKQTVISSKDSNISDVTDVKNKDNKDVKDSVSSDSSKSSDKENRDAHKKDDKKSSSSSDKKNSSHHSSSSSSKSSSKHSSSSNSHRSSSTSHKSSSSSSSHRSGSGSSSKSLSSKDKSSRDKDKHSSKHSSSKSRSEREKEREKEKQKKDQAEKDKATLEKIQGQTLSSKLGKIPKKKAEDDKSSDSAAKKSSTTDSREATKDGKDKTDQKKSSTSAAAGSATLPEKKSISISIENRKNSQDLSTRPKTVKTFNSKFRSTGLEEEAKPPPPRTVKKPNPIVDKKIVPSKLPAPKRPSPPRDSGQPADKRARLSLDSPTTPPADEKKGGIKLIPPKPKPMVLQESDMFMDALTASTKSKEPRKRKRRTSITKDGPTEPKKQETTSADSRESTPPPSSPISADEKSPVVVKPNFKFYQDTLETDEDKEQKEKEKVEENSKKDKEDEDELKENREINDDDTGSNTPTPDDDAEDTKTSESPEEISAEDAAKGETSPYPEIRYVDGLKSVLLLQKRRGPKKSLKWKTDLESIRYFELDETERVNVTKTFTDMKQMEKQNEREAFIIARKISNEDLMEERTRWKPLIPIDLPPPLVEPGKDSREKDIQYAREKGILQALYFNRSMIPDSAAEPDEERHHLMTDPKVIPLDDLTGNKESEKDFTSVPWPEPKVQIPPQPQPMTNFPFQPFPHGQQPIMTSIGPQGNMAIPQMQPQMMPPTHMGQMPGPDMSAGGPMIPGGGAWRTGDGKVVMPDVGMNPMGNMPGGFPPGMEGGPPGMVPPGMMGPPMFNQQQDGYGMMGPEEMGYNPNMNPNNFQGPPPGPMYGPGPNFQGPRGGGPMRGRGGPGPGWFRGGGGPPGRGGWRGGGGGWRGSGKQPPVCRQFSKNGYCRVGDKCQYLHPGINCPPF